MAISPGGMPPGRTGPGRTGPGGQARGRPAARRPRERVPAQEAGAFPRLADTAPTPGFRLRTATTETDIDRQIVRLMRLLAHDDMDPDAPPGSYLNFLL